MNNLHNGRGFKAQYGHLWIHKDNQVSLNKNIRNYIDKIEY